MYFLGYKYRIECIGIPFRQKKNRVIETRLYNIIEYIT